MFATEDVREQPLELGIEVADWRLGVADLSRLHETHALVGRKLQEPTPCGGGLAVRRSRRSRLEQAERGRLIAAVVSALAQERCRRALRRVGRRQQSKNRLLPHRELRQ